MQMHPLLLWDWGSSRNKTQPLATVPTELPTALRASIDLQSYGFTQWLPSLVLGYIGI